MSRNLYCNINVTAFNIIALSCRQQESGSSYTTMHVCSQHYLSKNFCQYIKSQCCSMCHIIQICHLSSFSYSHNWNEHWKAIAMLTFRPFRWLWQNSSSAYQKVLTRTALKTSRNNGSGVLMHEEAISKEILSTRV